MDDDLQFYEKTLGLTREQLQSILLRNDAKQDGEINGLTIKIDEMQIDINSIYTYIREVKTKLDDINTNQIKIHDNINNINDMMLFWVKFRRITLNLIATIFAVVTTMFSVYQFMKSNFQ